MKSRTFCTYCHDAGRVVEKRKTEFTRKLYGDVFIDFVTVCPICHGQEAIRREQEETMNSSMIPEIFYDQTFEAFRWDCYKDKDGNIVDLRKTKMLCERFIEKYEFFEERRIGLFFYSRMKGSGKTFLSCCISNELVKQKGVKPKFISCANLIPYSQKDDIQKLIDAELLLIDDLGATTNNEWLSDLLFRIIDGRYQNGKVTLFTANMEIKSLPFNDRTSDRINSLAIGVPLPDYCIRSDQAGKNKKELLKELNII